MSLSEIHRNKETVKSTPKQSIDPVGDICRECSSILPLFHQVIYLKILRLASFRNMLKTLIFLFWLTGNWNVFRIIPFYYIVKVLFLIFLWLRWAFGADSRFMTVMKNNIRIHNFFQRQREIFIAEIGDGGEIKWKPTQGIAMASTYMTLKVSHQLANNRVMNVLEKSKDKLVKGALH